ncbi:hypothetical protein M422DRAFT_259206 [Sphaerobolus stellatus SS14]|uniref:Uncharacterized protein n=1 Tax=Sphaerobolus stellatus (strain SS14) TaxID=990650 RepID=A0A0C9U518_SPHS4|nr:hypothetical protein M422DRAFT_259206 [Sphaerobolus stellatus SS14]
MSASHGMLLPVSEKSEFTSLAKLNTKYRTVYDTFSLPLLEANSQVLKGRGIVLKLLRRYRQVSGCNNQAGVSYLMNTIPLLSEHQAKPSLLPMMNSVFRKYRYFYVGRSHQESLHKGISVQIDMREYQSVDSRSVIAILSFYHIWDLWFLTNYSPFKSFKALVPKHDTLMIESFCFPEAENSFGEDLLRQIEHPQPINNCNRDEPSATLYAFHYVILSKSYMILSAKKVFLGGISVSHCMPNLSKYQVDSAFFRPSNDLTRPLIAQFTKGVVAHYSGWKYEMYDGESHYRSLWLSSQPKDLPIYLSTCPSGTTALTVLQAYSLGIAHLPSMESNAFILRYEYHPEKDVLKYLYEACGLKVESDEISKLMGYSLPDHKEFDFPKSKRRMSYSDVETRRKTKSQNLRYFQLPDPRRVSKGRKSFKTVERVPKFVRLYDLRTTGHELLYGDVDIQPLYEEMPRDNKLRLRGHYSPRGTYIPVDSYKFEM